MFYIIPIDNPNSTSAQNAQGNLIFFKIKFKKWDHFLPNFDLFLLCSLTVYRVSISVVVSDSAWVLTPSPPGS